MNKPVLICIFCFIFQLTFKISSAQVAKAPKKSNERLELYVDSAKDLISIKSIPSQEAPSLNERSSRAVFLPLVTGYLISQGVQGIQALINDRKNRYISQYDFSKLDHYFYDQVSTNNAFDPVGLKFKGIKILRMAKNKNGKEDTVLYAKFIIDTTNGRWLEIMNNGIFRLRLDTIYISGSRVKAPKDVKNLSVDIEIDISSTYRSDNGDLNADKPLGKFIYSLRNAPLLNKGEKAEEYYDNLDKTKPSLTGSCFMVPRSAGYYINKEGLVQPCWGMGLFSVHVSVKETSKMKFIDKLIIWSEDPTVQVGSSTLQKKYGNAITPTAAPASKTSEPAKSSTKQP